MALSAASAFSLSSARLVAMPPCCARLVRPKPPRIPFVYAAFGAAPAFSVAMFSTLNLLSVRTICSPCVLNF